MGRRKDNLRWMVQCKFPDDSPPVIESGKKHDTWGNYCGPMASKNDCIEQCRFDLRQYPVTRWEGMTQFRAAGFRGRKLIEVVNLRKPKR